MKLDPVLLDILVCPDCKGELRVDDDHDELICIQCGLIYPVRDNIPVMLVDEARRPESDSTDPGDSSDGDGDGDASSGDDPPSPDSAESAG